MADIDLKTETPDTSLPSGAVFFGADSQSAARPGVYPISLLKTADSMPYEITASMTNTQAQAIITAAAAAGRDVWMRDGEHGDRNLTLPNGDNIRIFGAGVGNTILVPNSSGDDVMALTAGQITHSIHLSDFGIAGTQDGTGSGIYIPTTATVFSALFENLYVYGMGGSGFRDYGTTFTATLRNIRADECLDHLFDIEGGNTYMLEQCYAMNVPTAGKAGFRHRRGTPLYTSCNGINSGDYWGIFGRSVATDGGSVSYCYPVLKNCNIEDFEVVGLHNRNASFNLDSCTILAPTTGTVTAVNFESQPNTTGTLTNTGIDTKGASWADGYPIHSRNRVPFIQTVDESATLDYYTYYDDQATVAMTMSAWRTDNVAYARHAARTKDLKVSDRFYLGTGDAFAQSGTGSPESVVTAPIGSIFLRTDGGAGTTLYVKESGTGNTGWVGK